MSRMSLLTAKTETWMYKTEGKVRIMLLWVYSKIHHELHVRSGYVRS